MKKYAVCDPYTGEYSYYDSTVAMNVKIAEIILAESLRLRHDALWSVVEFNDDGSETWRNPQGEEIPNLDIIRTELQSGLTNVTQP
jgi:hypothetical protein